MPVALLPDRALISVSGADARHFLQNIITTDLDKLATDEARPSALLTPQGKILFDFLVSAAEENRLTLDCGADVADDFIRRLTLYRLRAKVEIVKQDQAVVAVAWAGDSTGSGAESSLRDTRFAPEAGVLRLHGSAVSPTVGVEAWDRLRIEHGVAESGTDYALGDAFPHDVLLDENGGVGFRKGCYIGQEVVSRMQHRGTARRRVLIVEAQADLPAGGTELMAGGRPIGTLGSVEGRHGLAIARIDKVKAALDGDLAITAGQTAVSLSIPAAAKFSFPQEPNAAEDA